MTQLTVKRVYLPASDDDGWRVLVDRLWPRGLAKVVARIDHWDKAIAPSDELRHWFGHEPGKWSEFRHRYFAELDAQAGAVRALCDELQRHPRVCLLFAARDEAHNNAVALRAYLARYGLR
jgi:uncharacterized protein YeaO (DUF488 family)